MSLLESMKYNPSAPTFDKSGKVNLESLPWGQGKEEPGPMPPPPGKPTSKLLGEINRASRRQTQNVAQSSMKKRNETMGFNGFGFRDLGMRI